jgi:hypothetical protein
MLFAAVHDGCGGGGGGRTAGEPAAGAGVAVTGRTADQGSNAYNSDAINKGKQPS